MDEEQAAAFWTPAHLGPDYRELRDVMVDSLGRHGRSVPHSLTDEERKRRILAERPGGED